MLLHTDIPSRGQIERLLEADDGWCVSIYIPTDPVSSGTAERTMLKNLSTSAIGQLEEVGADRDVIATIAEELDEIEGDDAFWAYQARSLAVFCSAERVTTFKLANNLSAAVEVSDRFHVKPLLRSHTFGHNGFVLALAQGSVRVLEISAGMEPQALRLADLPSDIASFWGKASVTDRSADRRIQGSEGLKLRMRAYARAIEESLRPLLNGSDTPLLLCAVEPLASIYRSVNSYPLLLDEGIDANPEASSDAELAASARNVLDRVYETELDRVRGRFESLRHLGRASSDLAEVAHAATYGSVDTLLVDIDAQLAGVVDPDSGEITPADAGARSYGLADEVARRVWRSSGEVLAVRAQDIPGGGPVAAILRYPLMGALSR